MDDRDIVAAIVAGDGDGIAYAYRKYAASLYRYCHWMVPESADATVALQDTFVIAAAKLGRLRDPRDLRPWLYAVARSECHRWRRPAQAAPVPAEAAEEGAEPRKRASAALGGLGPGEREVVELNLAHHLAGNDLAAVLGVSRRQAHAMVRHVRGRLEKSLGAPLAGRSGDLDQALRSALARRSALPRALRQEVVRLCVEATAEAVAYREWVIQRAGQFGLTGFPRPIRQHRRMIAVAGTAAAVGILIAIASTGIVTVLTLSGAHAPRSLDAARADGGPVSASTWATRNATATGSAIATRSATATAGTPVGAAPARGRPAASGLSPSADASASRVAASVTGSAGVGAASPSGSAQSSSSSSSSPSASPTPASHQPSPAPSPDLQWPPPPPPPAGPPTTLR